MTQQTVTLYERVMLQPSRGLICLHKSWQGQRGPSMISELLKSIGCTVGNKCFCIS